MKVDGTKATSKSQRFVLVGMFRRIRVNTTPLVNWHHTRSYPDKWILGGSTRFSHIAHTWAEPFQVFWMIRPQPLRVCFVGDTNWTFNQLSYNHGWF